MKMQLVFDPFRQFGTARVFLVAQDGMADDGHMRAKLMLPPGDRLERDEGDLLPGTVDHGHGGRPAGLVDHLLWLRARHDDDGGFPVVTVVAGATVVPADALRTFAVVRLLLDGVPRVGCAWSAYGPSLAQLGLQFGVADLDGAADGVDVRAELTHLVWDGGFRPVERDVRHAVRHTYDPAPSLAGRRAEPQRVWA